mgnify:CR=1 FL=1
MTSRERVRKALEHQQPDRVPVGFGASAVSGMHVTCVAALREYYGLERHPVKVIDPHQMLGEIEEDLKEALHIDVEGILAPNTSSAFATTTGNPGICTVHLKYWSPDNSIPLLTITGTS